jgi:hypothetical protein
LTNICRELGGAVGKVHLFADGPPSAQVPMPKAPLSSWQRSNSFFIFGLSFIKKFKKTGAFAEVTIQKKYENT